MSDEDDTTQAVTLALVVQKLDDVTALVAKIDGRTEATSTTLAGMATALATHEIRIGALEQRQKEADRERLQRRGLVLQGWQAFAPIVVGAVSIMAAVYEMTVRLAGRG